MVFLPRNGCRASRAYTVIAEVPEHGLAASQHIEYASMEANPCAEASSADVEASLSWSDETTMDIAALMSSEADDYLRMAQPCAFGVEFLNLDNEVVHQFQTLCDAYDGRKILLPSSEEPLQFDPHHQHGTGRGSPWFPTANTPCN